jgi:hypothetical protein
LTLSQDDEQAIELFEWSNIAVARADSMEQRYTTLLARFRTAEDTINSLNRQLDELILSKSLHEQQLMSNFVHLLNEKKLKIRNQQRLLASAKVDPEKRKALLPTIGFPRQIQLLTDRKSLRYRKQRLQTGSSQMRKAGTQSAPRERSKKKMMALKVMMDLRRWTLTRNSGRMKVRVRKQTIRNDQHLSLSKMRILLLKMKGLPHRHMIRGKKIKKGKNRTGAPWQDHHLQRESYLLQEGHKKS